MRAIIQYNCIPHYRARIFELLSQYEDVNFSVVADPEPDTPYLRTITESDQRAIRVMPAHTRIIRIPKMPDFYWQPGALQCVIREHPDAVIALGSPYSLTAWAMLIYGRLRKVPILLWSHGLLKEESGPKWWLRRLLFRLADGLLLYGDYAKELLQKKGFSPERMFVVYNSLDFDTQTQIARQISSGDIAEFRASLGVRENERLVAYTGRIQPEKRLDLLIQAVVKLAREGKYVHVVLVGEGGAREAIAQMADKAGIASYVHFLGEQYDEKYLGTILGASDLAVIPSAAGLSIMHAFVFGTPVLIHDRIEFHGPEWEAVIDGKTGFFYRYGDINDLAAKMEQAIFPVPAKSTMADACKSVINEKYNPHRQVETFVRAVRESARGMDRRL
jgi:L-malate glycosyltransferase